MKVGYVLGTYPRATDTFIQREVQVVRGRGVDVTTFSVREPSTDQLVGPEQVAEHSRTTYLLAAGGPALLSAVAVLLLRSPVRWCRAFSLMWSCRQAGLRGTLLHLMYFAEAALLARRARAESIQHLHNHFGDQSGTVTMLAAELAGTSFSMTVHGPDVFFERRRWRLDMKAQRAAFVACISHFSRSQLMAITDPTVWPRLHIIHCGVTPSLFEAPVPDSSGIRLTAVGRLDAVKGIDVLLSALEMVLPMQPQTRLALIGDGPDRERLEQRVNDLRLTDHVDFLGYLGQAEVRQEFRHTDVFVLSSFAEGVPVVLMEAMAARVPVIATNVMGVPELVEDGVVGHLVPPGDAAALADRVRDLIAVGPAERRLMGERGRRRVEQQFDVDIEAAKLAALFHER